MKLTPVFTFIVLMSVSAGSVMAETMEQRVARLEQVLESQSLVEMLARIDRLQQEVQQLRGELEEQSHTVEQLKQRQRELYLDIDRRLSQMEREGAAVASTVQDTAEQQAVIAAGSSQAAASTGDETRPATADLNKEREAYQKAFNLLRELRYDQATSAFSSFLKTYPNGRYAHIAQYWLGEAKYAQRHFQQAIADYRKLISSYPNSPKLAEAMLKIGYSYNELGQKEEARKALSELVGKYPGTTEAGQAEMLLKKLEK